MTRRAAKPKLVKAPVIKSSEDEQQVEVMKWAARHTARYPELDYLFHIPNGGKRGKLTAIKLQRAGVKSGVPDLCLPVPRHGWHGLWIEMKYGVNTTTPNQKVWLARLKEQGYFVYVAYGWEDAVVTIKDYLGITEAP